MSKPASTISQGSLKELYLQRQQTPGQLVLQVLAFQVSEFNPKEIILRISDREAFLDCLLVGPYAIADSRIVSTEYSRANQTFKRYDLVKVSDFFCKIDPSKICQLRIIVRRLEEAQGVGSQPGQILGKPEDVSQLVENAQLKGKPAALDNNKLIARGTEETPIKLEEIADQTYPQPDHHHPNPSNRSAPPGGQQTPATTPSDPRKQEEPLTLEDILAGKAGYFIGRLVRMKFGCKQAKDGPMSFLYLGFIDSLGGLVRIHLAGRTAIKQSKQLKKGRVYFIKGIELFQGDRVKGGPQIRLRDKQYKIHQIQNEAVRAQYKQEYYFWEHENEWVESEMVDVIGVVEGIEEKITYRNSNTYQEQRDVVRLSIRNAFKTVKISFWADHIGIIENLQLQRKQPILIEDIKKKKTIFLDFISESNIIILDEDPDLKERFAAFLPPFEEAPDPVSIKELLEVCSLQPYSTKVRHLTVRISSVNLKWIIYKMCNPCKKKVEKILQACLECSHSDFVYKYNCALELTDPSGSVNCIAFDPVCERVFNRTANQFSALTEEQVKAACEGLTADEWHVGIEFKNSRQIIRSIERPQHEEGTGQLEKFQPNILENNENNDFHQQ